jgi:F420-non-reducing hydrogenase small subunit
MSKPKIAFYWCASCGGCEEAIVDLDEKILDVVAAVDIVFWPCAMDFKYADVEAMPDQSIAVAFINGAVRNSEQEHVVKLLRRKAQLVIAFGMCAWMGGIPALANLKNKESILRRACVEDNPGDGSREHLVQGPVPSLPGLYETVHKLDDIIPVDYYVPGCPPGREIILQAVTAILTGSLPAKGAILAPNRGLCHSCSRNKTKPERMTLLEFKRIHQVAADPETCFLAQGILCMGPATREGCGELCVKGNMPCTGCYGPMNQADQGAKMLSALAGIFEAEDEAAVLRFVESIPDPAGSFYRYGLSGSLLGSKTPGLKENKNG